MQVDSSGLNLYWTIFRFVLCDHFYDPFYDLIKQIEILSNKDLNQMSLLASQNITYIRELSFYAVPGSVDISKNNCQNEKYLGIKRRM